MVARLTAPIRALSPRSALGALGVLWLAGTGGGQAPPIYPGLALAPSSTPEVGDFTSDGSLDVIAVGSSNIHLFAGDGSGNFAPPLVTSAPADSILHVADMNVDGKLDVVGTSSGHVSVSMGDGAGGLGPATTTGSAITLMLASAVADMSGEGRPDVVLVGGIAAGWAQALLGDGSGGFTSGQVVPIDPHPLALATGDLDGDGLLDAVVTQAPDSNASLPGTLKVLLGTGQGGLSPQPSQVVGNWPIDVVLGDIDSDGHLDALTSDQFSQQISVLLGDGTGSLLPMPPLAMDGVTGDIDLDDIDGDSILDLVVGIQFPGPSRLLVLPGDGAGGFGPPILDTAAAVVGGPIFADMNNDGLKDLIGWNGSALVFLADALAHFISAIELNFGPDLQLELYEGRQVASADLDLDGWADAVATVVDLAAVGVVPGGPEGQFGAPSLYPVNGVPTAVAVGDLNGDARPDMAVIRVFKANLVVLIADASGGYSAPLLLPIPAHAFDLAIDDLDHDGLGDIVVSLPEADKVGVFAGSATATFGPPQLYTVARGPRDVRISDLNNDGSLDVITANSSSSPINTVLSVLLGDGEGGFLPVLNQGPSLGTYALEVADLDSDGNEDVILAVVSELWVMMGDGTGAFGEPTIHGQVEFYPNAIATADVNGDGVPDVLTVSHYSNRVRVRLGDGIGGFASEQEFGTTAKLAGLVLADMSSDFKPDILSLGMSWNNATLLVNQSPSFAWTNLGAGLTGSAGLPQLTGNGTLHDGSAGQLLLTKAEAAAPAGLFVSLGAGSAPFKGGTLKAFPPILELLATTNAAGQLPLPFTWPAGVPAGLAFVFQWAVQDVAAVKGVSLSNALQAVTPLSEL